MKKGKKLHGNKETVVKVCNWLSLPLQALGCCILYLVIEAFSPPFAGICMELHGGKPMGLFVQCIFDLHYFYGSLSVPQTCAGTAGDELFLAAARHH